MTERTTRAEPAVIDRPAANRGRHPAVAGIASALLLVMAYEPVGAWWLAWVALVPLMLLARDNRRSTRDLALGAWAGGLVFWLIAVEWVRKSDPGAWPGWLAMAFLLSLFWPAFVLLTRVAVRGLGVPMMLAAPAAWVALEFFRAYYPINGFQWFYLAHSQARQTWLIQFIDLTGAWGLSFLVALGNAWIVSLLTLPLLRPTPRGIRLTKPQTVRLAIFLGLLVAALIYGAVRLGSARFEAGPRLALLQSDVPQDFRRPRNPNAILREFEALVDQAVSVPKAERPDLIVWPETMFPGHWIEIDPDLPNDVFERQLRLLHSTDSPESWRRIGDDVRRLLHDWTDRVGIPMLVGITSYEFRREGLRRFNAVILFRPGSRDVQFYRKIHLVPFGEYIPLVESFPFVLAFTPFDPTHLPSLDSGPGGSAFTLDGLRFGAVICFEDGVPQVARAVMRANGPEPRLLVNISNDGWFRATAAHRLHLDNSVLRAVEFRVPVARAVNTGISAIIDGNGRVLAELPEARKGVLHGRVPLDPRGSFYRAAGPWLPWSCVGLTIAALPLAAIRRRQRRTAGNSGATVAPNRPSDPGDLPAPRT